MSTEQESKENIKPGSDEYNQMMAEKFRAGHGEEQKADKPPVDPMPEGGFEKFYNKETGEYNWKDHATELQYRLEKSTPKDKQENEQEEKQGEDEEVADIITRAGLSPDDLEDKILTQGKLDDADIQALEKQGIPRKLIDLYVENYKTAISVRETESYEYVGGKEEWAKISAWAGQNLSEGERERVNAMLASPDWKIAVDGLKARMSSNKKGGNEPNLFGGNGNNGPQNAGYKSRAEMKADINSPLYKSDPAFRAQVALRIKHATWEYDK